MSISKLNQAKFIKREVLDKAVEKRYDLIEAGRAKPVDTPAEDIAEWYKKNSEDLIFCAKMNCRLHKNNCGKLKQCYLGPTCDNLNGFNWDESVKRWAKCGL